MLVLTRKHQEKIRIGESITITILRTKGKAVRLGIEAPADVPVIRGELAFDVSPEELTREIRGNKSPDAGRRTGGQAPQPKATWTTESHPNAPERGRDVDVSMRRVPRDQVAHELPKLSGATRPLRGMLDARSSTM
jgi:carbon storage regulator